MRLGQCWATRQPKGNVERDLSEGASELLPLIIFRRGGKARTSAPNCCLSVGDQRSFRKKRIIFAYDLVVSIAEDCSHGFEPVRVLFQMHITGKRSEHVRVERQAESALDRAFDLPAQKT